MFVKFMLQLYSNSYKKNSNIYYCIPTYKHTGWKSYALLETHKMAATQKQQSNVRKHQ